MTFVSGRLISPMWLAADAFAVVMLGTTLPTPLYPHYEQRYGFSALTITVIFAVYAFGVIAALLFLGGLSDQLGRRPALLVGLALSVASAAAFLLAGGLGALLAGRALSGLSAGIFTGTGTTTLVDLAPPGRRVSPPAWRPQSTSAALAADLCWRASWRQWRPCRCGCRSGWIWAYWHPPSPRSYACRKPCADPVPASLRMQRLRVPAELRGTFTRAATAGFASFTMSGLFSAVAPIFLATLLHLPSPALSGVTVFLLFASSAAGQLVITRIPARAGLSTGCIGVITGAGLVAAALALESLAFLIAGAIVAGLGQGLSVGAGLAAINAEAPVDRRAEVASSFFVVLYVGLSIPIIGTGLASQVIGLRASALIFSGFVAALAAACLISLLGRRPTGSSRPDDGAK